MRFFDYLAWTAAVLGWLGFVINFVGAVRYEGSLEMWQDYARGMRTRFPIGGFFVAAMVATIWLVAR